jgi:hypothetical protein
MSILNWNCRGLGQPAKVQELPRLVRKFCPKIVFVSETRQQKSRVSNLGGRLGLKHAFVVDGHGKSGGLALLWDESIKLSVLSYGMHYIDTLIWDGDHHASWRGIFVYGEPRVQDHHNMWEVFEKVKTNFKSPMAANGRF